MGWMSFLPSDLAGCVRSELGQLSTAQLRALGQTNAPPSSADRQLEARLAGACVREGKGVVTLRGLALLRVGSAIPKGLPPSLKSCIQAKATRGLTPDVLAQLLSAYLVGGRSGLDARGTQLGKGLAAACARDPTVVRALVLGAVQRLIKKPGLAGTLVKCMVRRTQQIPGSQLEQFALHPLHAPGRALAIGRDLLEHCVVSGLLP